MNETNPSKQKNKGLIIFWFVGTALLLGFQYFTYPPTYCGYAFCSPIWNLIPLVDFSWLIFSIILCIIFIFRRK